MMVQWDKEQFSQKKIELQSFLLLLQVLIVPKGALTMFVNLNRDVQLTKLADAVALSTLTVCRRLRSLEFYP